MNLVPLDVAPRLPRLRARLADAGIDALLVTKLANVRYLTGFTGSAAVLLVGADDALFVTDGRYIERSKEELQGKIKDLEKFEDAVVGRELKMIALEKELNALKKK